MYTTLARPIFEYASVVWDPHLQCLIDKIEMVQRRAARWVKLDYRQTSSVTDMMNDLQWSTLLERKKYSRLTFFINFYTMTHQISVSQNIIYLTPCLTLRVCPTISN